MEFPGLPSHHPFSSERQKAFSILWYFTTPYQKVVVTEERRAVLTLFGLGAD